MSPLSAGKCAFIDRHRVAHLATADAHGVPHVIPIVYARLGDHMYFIVDEKPKRTRTGLRRLVNIAQNPQIAFIIDDYDEDWSRLGYLLIQGEAAKVSNSAEYARSLAALRDRYPQYASMQLALASHPMVRIRPQRSYLWRAASPDIQGLRR